MHITHANPTEGNILFAFHQGTISNDDTNPYTPDSLEADAWVAGWSMENERYVIPKKWRKNHDKQKWRFYM